MTAPAARSSIREMLRHRLRNLRPFLAYLVSRVLRDNCLQNAATLSYTTLLSIVPLLAVGFAVLAAFPVFEPISDRIRHIIFANLVPATGVVVEQYVERFISKAAGLTAAGIAGLMVSALLLMSAIDKALNDIWSVHQRRRPLHGFMIYWTVLTLSPLLIGASVLLTTYIENFSAGFATGARELVLTATPFVAELLIFTFMYSAVPNRRVPLTHAIAGAVLAALMFELAKLGFAWYVQAVPTYEAIYGALAALPLFLLWIYVCWVIVLIGAEFTQALSGHRMGRPGTLADPALELLLAVRLLDHLWRAQQHGVSATSRALARREPEAGELAVNDALERLEASRVVIRTERGGWVLARDPATYSLLDLYRSRAFALPDLRARVPRDELDERIAGLLAQLGAGVDKVLDVPMERLFGEQGRQGESQS